MRTSSDEYEVMKLSFPMKRRSRSNRSSPDLGVA